MNSREHYLKINAYYYTELLKFFRFNIQPGSKVLEIGCGIGNLLAGIKPKIGVGIDILPKMIEEAKKRYPKLIFHQMDAQDNTLNDKFDYVILSDTLGYFEDIQRVFVKMKKNVTPHTRIIITYHNFLWQPLLDLVERLHLKMPQKRLNWLNYNDISNLLYLEGYDVVKRGGKLLIPIHIPFFSNIINRYFANIPLINKLCLVEYIIARIKNEKNAYKTPSVSVIVPARNEFGNIENVVKRLPKLGKHTELIFIEGHSSDKTLGEIKRVCEKYSKIRDLKYRVQNGKGKGDAVRKGFFVANGDILMILDADLSVAPEDLIKFYKAIVTGKGEFINGSRLVYPIENEAMRNLNILGNNFFSLVFSYLLGQRLKDTLCGTKVILAEDYAKIAKGRSYFGNFDPFGDFDLLFGAAKLNLKIVEVPIRYRSRTYGKTNISRFKHGWLLLKMIIFAMSKIKFI